MKEKREQVVDRRSDTGRRKAYDLNSSSRGGSERRRVKERRSREERRTGWLRVSKWYSVCLQAIKRTKGFWNS